MSEEENRVKQAINYYFEGTRDANIDLLKKGYTEDCKIYFVNEDGALDYLDQPKFHQVVEEMHQVSGERHNTLLSLEITENIAAAKTKAEYPAFYFTDYLSLAKIGHEWKIVNKITVRKER